MKSHEVADFWPIRSIIDVRAWHWLLTSTNIVWNVKKMIMWDWKEGNVWYSENFADKEWFNGALFRNAVFYQIH